MATLRCLGLTPQQLDCFTSDPAASPVHVCGWGFLGDTWPYFRPNFVNLEQYREQYGAARVSPEPACLGQLLVLLALLACCSVSVLPLRCAVASV